MSLRRPIEAALAAAGLAVAALPMAVVGALVLALDGRPVLFRQQRSGLGGQPFTIVKFRTMASTTDRHGVPEPDADRVTWLGSLLRRCRLDELPQLWNVLVGEMGIIGPRPLLPVTIAALGDAGRRRGTIRPGLTGWAQVNGNTLLDAGEKLELDLWYVDHRSLGLDLAILWRTASVVVVGERRDMTAIGRAYARGADRRG